MPLVAACAVRVLARVETYIPTYPAVAERRPPVTKASPVIMPFCRLPPETDNATNTPMAKMIRTRHSALRNAMAPSWVALEISCIVVVAWVLLEDPPAEIRGNTESDDGCKRCQPRYCLVHAPSPFRTYMAREDERCVRAAVTRGVWSPLLALLAH